MIQNPVNPQIYKNLYLWYKLWPLYNWSVIYSLQEEESFKTHRLSKSLRPLGFISPFLLPTFVISGESLHPASLQGPTLANGDNNICLLELLWQLNKVAYVECLACNGHSVNENHHFRLQEENPKATFRKQTILIEVSARPKRQESPSWMMAFMALRVVQGLVFREKGPFLGLPPSPDFPQVCFPGSRSDWKRQVFKGDQPEVQPGAARRRLPGQERGGYLQASCQAGRQPGKPSALYTALRKLARLQSSLRWVYLHKQVLSGVD